MEEGYAYRYGYARGGLENVKKELEHIIQYSKLDDDGPWMSKRTVNEMDFQRLLSNVNRNLEALDIYDKQ